MKNIAWFQEAQRIHGICPCCETVFRLSDAVIYDTTRPPMTPFDRVRAAMERHERRVEKFDEDRDEILAEERERGLAEADEQLKRIAPDLVGRNIDPRDVRVVFDPVKYVVFHGLCNDDITGIELVSDEPTTAAGEKVLRSIDVAIKKGNIDWATWRVTDIGKVVCERR